jgi:DNA-binding NarL/FixJ family response regulator
MSVNLPYFKALAVDDHEQFRQLVCLILQQNAELEVVGQASDGLEAVQKAEELQPDLILLDIGLPKLNGIEAAKRIRKLAPYAKILFLSQESSSDVVQEALNLGALGYVHKLRAQRELLPAIEAVLRGNRFVGGGLKGTEPGESTNAYIPSHEVQFYSDDAVFVESFTRFIAAALKAGKAVIVLISESHRHSLLQRLKAQGLDVAAAIETGNLIPLDNAETLAKFMVDDMPDQARLFEVVGGLIKTAAQAAKTERPRIAACGECAPLLWLEGKVDAAIRLEQLWDQLVKTYEFDTLCGYALSSFQGEKGEQVFQSICAEHSAAYSR